MNMKICERIVMKRARRERCQYFLKTNFSQLFLIFLYIWSIQIIRDTPEGRVDKRSHKMSHDLFQTFEVKSHLEGKIRLLRAPPFQLILLF